VINRQYGELVHLCGPKQKTHLFKIILISELPKYAVDFPTHVRSETSFLQSWVLCISRMYTLHGPTQMPVTVMLNVNEFYRCTTFSLNLHFIFLALATKMYLILRYVV
jgi:hypothetical protein